MTESRGNRSQPEQSAADQATGNRSGSHHQDEAAVLSQHGEAAIATVAGEADDHRRQADGERQTPCELNVRTEQQY